VTCEPSTCPTSSPFAVTTPSSVRT
jgi:hypothetical protein